MNEQEGNGGGSLQAGEGQADVGNGAEMDTVISPDGEVFNHISNFSNHSKKITSKHNSRFSNWRDNPEVCPGQTNYGHIKFDFNSSELELNNEVGTAGGKCDAAESNSMLRDQDQAGGCPIM